MHGPDPNPDTGANSLDIPFRELQNLLEGISDGIFITDADGVLGFANSSLAGIFGYDNPKDMHGKNLYFDFIPVTERPRIRQVFSEEIDRRARMFDPLCVTILGRHGEEKTVEIRASLRMSEGIVIGTQGTVTDISLRQQAEDKLQEAKELAEKASKMKDHFVATISHEIRTPMNSIQGFAALLGDSGCEPDSTEFKEYLEAIQAGSERLMRTIEMILNISRMSGDLFDPNIERLEVSPLLTTAVQDIRLAAEGKGLQIEIENQFPEATILGDRFCFLQSLTNLLENAVKYTDSGTITVHLFRDENSAVCIDIIDTGIGIDKNYLPSIFSNYSQEQSGYNRPYEGLGLGLALVKKYVQLNAGSISVESTKGEGSAFHLVYPYATREAGDAGTSSS